MPERILPKEERLLLKAQSHHLDPIVLLGAAGLSAPALKEIDRALGVHGLIKVRMPAVPRGERVALFAQVAEDLDAARIQLVGRQMVLFRPLPEPAVKPVRKARQAKQTKREAQAARQAKSPKSAGSARLEKSPKSPQPRRRPAQR